jgi:hypothetical protein
MSRLSRLSRIAAAGALVVSAVAVFSVGSAGAANTEIQQDCSSGGVQTAGVANSDTVTVTIGAGSCLSATLDVNGTSATAALNNSPMTDGTPANVASGDSIVVTVPANGQGTVYVRFADTNANVPVVMIDFGYPPVTGSMVDNGNGSMTITYSGTGLINNDHITVLLYPADHTCALGDQTEPLFILDPDMPGIPLAASPAVVTAGTMAGVFNQQGPPSAAAITAGSYQACMILQTGNNQSLAQSMAITLGAVAPTTTTTTTAAGADPVTPAFAG